MTIALIILAALVILFFSVLLVFYFFVYYMPHRGMTETHFEKILLGHPYVEDARRATEEMAARRCERIATRSHDKLRLSARFFRGDESMPVCILFHGYHGSGVRDFSGVGRDLINKGYNVIMVDERNHWRSEGHTITFGMRERYDVLTWVKKANRLFSDDKPIYIFGISMGAATVLMASGLELPENVRCILADCPYNDVMDEMAFAGSTHMKTPAALSKFLARASAKIYGRFDIAETTVADEVKKTKVPILIMHGEEDNLVPCYMSKQIKEANPDMIELHIFPEARHGQSYLFHKEEYRSIMDRFMQDNL